MMMVESQPHHHHHHHHLLLQSDPSRLNHHHHQAIQSILINTPSHPHPSNPVHPSSSPTSNSTPTSINFSQPSTLHHQRTSDIIPSQSISFSPLFFNHLPSSFTLITDSSQSGSSSPQSPSQSIIRFKSSPRHFSNTSPPSSKPISRLSTSRPLTKIRHADHLLSAPGVSFAPWLSQTTSPLGTRRSVSIIISHHSTLLPSRSSIPSNLTDPLLQPTLSLQPLSSPSTQSEQFTPLIPNHPVSSSVSIPTQPPLKPKSWADLLRSTPKSQSISSHDPNPSLPQPSTSNGILHPIPSTSLSHSDQASNSVSLFLVDQLRGIENQKYGPYLIPRGLINNGNICFANAVSFLLSHRFQSVTS